VNVNANLNLKEYVARIEEACGEERDVIIHFRFEKKDEAMGKILKKAKIEKTIAGIIFDLTYKGLSIRLYNTGKAIIKRAVDKDQAQSVLAELLL
jgi:ribonuclease HIII